jgi:hypothetical protein
MSIHHAFACDCPMPPKTSDEILKGITVLFEGEIMDVAIKSDKSDNELRRDDERVTTFRVLRTIKGKIPDTVDVWTRTRGESCGVHFGEIGERLFIGADESGEKLYSNSCLMFWVRSLYPHPRDRYKSGPPRSWRR